jgi:hypothetical protein
MPRISLAYDYFAIITPFQIIIFRHYAAITPHFAAHYAIAMLMIIPRRHACFLDCLLFQLMPLFRHAAASMPIITVFISCHYALTFSHFHSHYFLYCHFIFFHY